MTAAKLSKTSKLDGILSWSLQALETCQGSVNRDGSLVPACRGCYATTGFYQFAPAKAVRATNKELWQDDAWVSDMVQALDNQRYMRWFDSGDMYSIELAEKIYSVMLATPWVQHWLPTRMAKFKKYNDVLARMQRLPNVMVRFSSDSVQGEYNDAHGSVIVESSEQGESLGVKVCRAYEHGGKCNGCRACWDKKIPVIGYVAHGKKMAKVIRLIKA